MRACGVSVFSDTANVRVGLFLPLADHFLPLIYVLINKRVHVDS